MSRQVARWAVALVIAAHGLVHLLAAARASDGVEAVTWLAAAALVLASSVLVAVRRRGWWLVTGGAAVASQLALSTRWPQARAGTVVNLLMLAVAAYGYARHGPRSFQVQYDALAAAATAGPKPAARVVTDGDLGHLPGAVAQYVRNSGAVGQPRVVNVRARVHGRIRSGSSSRWMRFTGEQLDTCDDDPIRLLHLDASLLGVPMDVLHAFTRMGATSRIRLCSLVPVAEASGPELTRAETLSLFDDLCVLAPAVLVDLPVMWDEVDPRRVRGTWSWHGQRVSAELRFSDVGDLVEVVSSDRLRASADGKQFTPQRWSTPVGDYRMFGARRVATRSERVWHAPEPEGAFSYAEFVVDDVAYNVTTADPEVTVPVEALRAPAGLELR